MSDGSVAAAVNAEKTAASDQLTRTIAITGAVLAALSLLRSCIDCFCRKKRNTTSNNRSVLIYFFY